MAVSMVQYIETSPLSQGDVMFHCKFKFLEFLKNPAK